MDTTKPLERMPVKQFVETGLLLIVNQILHIFGWALVAENSDEHPETFVLYPARCKFRGFSGIATDAAYKKVSSWMAEHAAELKEEAGA